ncbi:MAG: glycoside hydrolase family 57 protein [Bacteroidales bacterium]|nr:glycoside hydrolase family 57 protein [Bacteroidales bacterium]
MRTICLYFQVHQPFRLKKYRFFNIGNDHYYYDDYLNESVMKKIIEKCYFPANEILFDLIQKYNGKFKVAFSISGVAIKQFELYAPEVLKSFKKLAESGSVEFLAETNAHSLVALKDKQAFCEQVKTHSQKIEKHFNQSPSVFRNTELIYSDEIGATVSEMGYKAMLTEGAKHVLGWKSPNYLYCNAIKPRLKILLKNFKLSDDIAFRFSSKTWEEWPLTTEKFVSWLNNLDPKEEVVNLFMDYETFGEHQWHETGIFDFLKFLPETVFNNSNFTFSTPSEVAEKLQPVSAIHVPHPISWADEERDLTAWLGNDLQEEAFSKLYSLSGKISKCKDQAILEDWNWLQTSDHFYYMCTKFFSDGDVHEYFNPYESPYEAFINYMNVLSDFEIRLNTAMPETNTDKELAKLRVLVAEKEDLLDKYMSEVNKLKLNISKPKTSGTKKASSKATPGKTKTPGISKTGRKSTKVSRVKKK